MTLFVTFRKLTQNQMTPKTEHWGIVKLEVTKNEKTAEKPNDHWDDTPSNKVAS